MREYRGKRVDNDEWVEGYLVYITSPRKNLEVPIIIPLKWINDTTMSSVQFNEHNLVNNLDIEVREVIPETVGQFTGKFCGKIKLYEHDILETDNTNSGYGDPKQPEKINLLISWCKDDACFVIGDNLMDVNLDCYKIIGNKIDNPELLETNNE